MTQTIALTAFITVFFVGVAGFYFVVARFGSDYFSFDEKMSWAAVLAIGPALFSGLFVKQTQLERQRIKNLVDKNVAASEPSDNEIAIEKKEPTCDCLLGEANSWRHASTGCRYTYTYTLNDTEYIFYKRYTIDLPKVGTVEFPKKDYISIYLVHFKDKTYISSYKPKMEDGMLNIFAKVDAENSERRWINGEFEIETAKATLKEILDKKIVKKAHAEFIDSVSKCPIHGSGD